MKHTKGEVLYYIPFDYKPCTVVHVTPYHEDGDPNAFVTVELDGGDLRNVPVAIQHRYLATEEPKKRPQKQEVNRRPGILGGVWGSIFGNKPDAKFALFFALCSLFAFQGTAQSVVTKDTTYQTSENGKFYFVREIEYSNGESSVNKALIGDTMTVYNNAFDRFRNEGVRMANDAREASRFDTYITRMLQEGNFLFASTGRDVLDSLAATYAGPLLITGWTIDDGGPSGALDIAFTINANGQLRYQIAGFSARNAFIFSNTMRLQNYKDGGRLDLYKARGGNWFSIDDEIKMKFPNNQDGASNRAASGAIKEAEPAPAATPKKTRKPKN
ncbi:MAG: hypothetical protein KDC70_00250 [Saprospiraceae bacterium]|nr:hypothetical protein [Saprospiraceae bacterium]